MDELKKLYTLKGELLTQIEIAQARLKSVNSKIAEIINNSSKSNEQQHSTSGLDTQSKE